MNSSTFNFVFFKTCSGPSRFDWDETLKAWVYRRTKANLLTLLEDEIRSLCGKPIALS
ncbi:hypothetical protein KSP39_PZI017244 [Platanthera zijinensis]|uniref:Uncharacterized protein n=1 Tax=Platanthera zijinensis TaxID=2320716 RepID=A0AAP0G0F1_9ASPA